MNLIKKLLFILTTREIKFAVFLLFMILIMALIDVIGVASILPFITVLTNPSVVETNAILNYMYQISAYFGVKNNQEFLFGLGIFVFALLVSSQIFKALTTYLQLRFTAMLEHKIGKRLVEIYLHQPYSWFLGHHSADLGKNILSEVSLIISSFIKPSIDILAKSIVLISLTILLILADPKLAFIIGFSLSGCYFLIFYLSRRFLSRLGLERLKNNELRFKTVSEAFSAAKEIKIGGLEQNYIKRFSLPSKIFATNFSIARIVSQLPRYFLETITFGGAILLILYLMMQKGSFNNALPIISLYIFAGYRMMPGLHSLYSSFVTLTFVGPSIDKLYQDMKTLKKINLSQNQSNSSLKKNIILNKVDYIYPNASRTTLKNIELIIPTKSTVGLIGATGSGKTTIVDIILGLLEPKNGFLKVDGKIITQQNLRSWQQTIGYVPQNINLIDDTVLANIAFGIDFKDINKERVEQVSKIANLHNFVINELPKQYQTTIGERGVRLSGGQRQRIGIARALYHRPQLLVLDEATSALDNNTEQAVMDAVDNLSKEMTIIMIAHRLNTVKRCDKIYLIEKGEIKNQGTYKELINDNETYSLNNKD